MNEMGTGIKCYPCVCGGGCSCEGERATKANPEHTHTPNPHTNVSGT